MNNRNRTRTTTVITLVIILVITMLLFAWLYNRDALAPDPNATEPRINSSEMENISEDETLPLSEISANPDKYIGEQVTLKGEVREVLSNRIIKITDDTASDELVVLFNTPLNSQQSERAGELLKSGANIIVKGQLFLTTASDTERDFGIDISPETEDEFENKIILAAGAITFTDQDNEEWLFTDSSPPADSSE